MKNFAQMMQKAQEMQTKMSEMQEGLAAIEIEASAGGGLVHLVLNGRGDLQSVRIDEKLFQEADREMLEDLIVAAHRQARKKMEEASAEKMKDLTGGLSLPPGFKLPF